jgi:proline iminopeptidase
MLPRPWSFHHVWNTEVDYGFFTSNGVDLYYEIEGKGRETVVVVHGCPGIPHDYLHPMLSTLGNHVKVVYFDRRFDGLPKGLPRHAMSISSMTEDLDALRQALNLERFTILAHGFGGSVALSYALRHPDRVKRLIMVSASAVMENPVDVERRLIEALTPEQQAAYRAVEEGASSALERDRKRYRILFNGCFHRAPEAAMLDRDTYYIYFQTLARRSVLSGEPGGFDARPRLGTVKAPALVIAGRHDVVTPVSHAVELARGLPNSKLAVMERSGHFPYTEEASLFTEWIRRFVYDTADHGEDSRTSTLVTATETR